MNTKIKQTDISALDKNEELSKKRVKEEILLRMKRHLDKIEEEKRVIIDNIDFPDIVSKANERIKSRQAKIEEIEDILQYLFK